LEANFSSSNSPRPPWEVPFKTHASTRDESFSSAKSAASSAFWYCPVSIYNEAMAARI
jgi:hypothetical protein